MPDSVRALTTHSELKGASPAAASSSVSVAVDAHAKGVLTPLNVAVVAVAAVAAGDMALAADTLANGKAGDTLAQGSDLAHILVADGHRRLDVLGSPGIPVVNMYVSAADGSLVNLDENFARAGDGNGHLPQLQTGASGGFYDSVHVLFHICPPQKNKNGK